MQPQVRSDDNVNAFENNEPPKMLNIEQWRERLVANSGIKYLGIQQGSDGSKVDMSNLPFKRHRSLKLDVPVESLAIQSH